MHIDEARLREGGYGSIVTRMVWGFVLALVIFGGIVAILGDQPANVIDTRAGAFWIVFAGSLVAALGSGALEIRALRKGGNATARWKDLAEPGFFRVAAKVGLVTGTAVSVLPAILLYFSEGSSRWLAVTGLVLLGNIVIATVIIYLAGRLFAPR